MSIPLTPVEPRDTLPTAGRTGTAVDFPAREVMPLDGGDSQHEIRSTLLKYLSLAIKHKYLIAAICSVFLLGGFLRPPRLRDFIARPRR